MKQKIELSEGSYTISDISDYFKYTIKKHETVNNMIIQQ